MCFILTATYNQGLKYHKKEKKEGCFPNLQTLKQKTVMSEKNNVKAKLLWGEWGGDRLHLLLKRSILIMWI